MSDLSTWNPPASAAPYLDAIRQAESAYNLPKNLLARLLYQESRYRTDIITGATRSPVGAMGIAQVMPATANDPGFGVGTLNDPLDPYQAIPWAARYLKALYLDLGRWDGALAAYNWGIGYVRRVIAEHPNDWINYAPLETRNYVAQIGADIPAVYV